MFKNQCCLSGPIYLYLPLNCVGQFNAIPVLIRIWSTNLVRKCLEKKPEVFRKCTESTLPNHEVHWKFIFGTGRHRHTALPTETGVSAEWEEHLFLRSVIMYQWKRFIGQSNQKYIAPSLTGVDIYGIEWMKHP